MSRVDVVAGGAPGAAGDFYPINGASPAPGGAGAKVSGDLTGLTTGDTLYVNVGGRPTGGERLRRQALTATAGSTVAETQAAET